MEPRQALEIRVSGIGLTWPRSVSSTISRSITYPDLDGPFARGVRSSRGTTCPPLTLPGERTNERMNEPEPPGLARLKLLAGATSARAILPAGHFPSPVDSPPGAPRSPGGSLPGAKRKRQNIQQQVFAGGHPPNY